MPPWLASHLICELYHAIIFYYVLNLSTILVHSITLPMHQPFDTVMANSGVKTRSSEQTMLSNEAHILLVTDSSSEEDSETDDQSYLPPPRCMLQLGRVMLLISCIWYLALLCHLLSLDMLCVNATCLVSNYHICELCNAILLQDIIYANYAMLSCCKALYM